MKLERTKEWRESLGLTQRQLAAEAGVGEVTVARIETGASVTPPTARKIAGALGVTVADLMERPPVPLGESALVGRAAEFVIDTLSRQAEEHDKTFTRLKESSRDQVSSEHHANEVIRYLADLEKGPLVDLCLELGERYVHDVARLKQEIARLREELQRQETAR